MLSKDVYSMQGQTQANPVDYARQTQPGANAPKQRAPEIPRAMETLEKSLLYCYDRAHILQEKLSVVVIARPANPSPDKTVSYNSPLAKALDGYTDRVQAISSLIEDLLESLEL